jgi:hypothetical protein
MATDTRLARWVSCPLDKRTVVQLPASSAVYAIYRDGALVYIGSTCNLPQRLKAHSYDDRWRRGVALVKYSLTSERWRERERRLVKRLLPAENMQYHPERGKPRRWRLVGGQKLFVTGREAMQIESDRRSALWRASGR